MYPNYYENFGKFNPNIQNLVDKNRKLFLGFNLDNTKKEIENCLVVNN